MPVNPLPERGAWIRILLNFPAGKHARPCEGANGKWRKWEKNRSAFFFSDRPQRGKPLLRCVWRPLWEQKSSARTPARCTADSTSGAERIFPNMCFPTERGFRIICWTGDFISQRAIFRNKSKNAACIIQSQSNWAPRCSSNFPIMYAITIFSAALSISTNSNGRTRSFHRSIEKPSNIFKIKSLRKTVIFFTELLT